jgi:lysophospholipase L1-like esterase
VPASVDRASRRGWVARVALASLAFTAAFFLCELGFRLVEKIQLERAGELWAVYDADIGWRLNPRFGDHNTIGLRDRPITPKGGRERILFLGDSVLYYGDGVDDTLVGHLRAELDTMIEPELVDVVNAGVKGYTNWQELQFLERHGLALEPDLVGVGFVLNDCYRMLHQFQVENDRIVGQGYGFSAEAVSAEPWLLRTLRKSHFLVWLRRRLPAVEGVPPGEFTFDHRPDFHAAWLDESWVAIEAQLREMVELGRTHDFAVFLVAFPFGDQYREEFLARDRDYVLKPQRKLAEICGRLGIPYLDLYPLLDASTDMDQDRIHLTSSGRENAAARIARFIGEEQLLRGR